MRHLVKKLAPAKVAKTVSEADPDVVFPFEVEALTDGRLAR